MASETYLFDRHRSGRSIFPLGKKLKTPILKWIFTLPTQNENIFGVESTPVFDWDGNIYFGSHDGNFYSVSKSGVLRWAIKTEAKIYSSPQLLIEHGRIIFCGGDGFFYVVSLKGDFIEKRKISFLNSNNAYFNKVINRLTKKETYDIDRRKHIRFKSWCSPNSDSKGQIYITGFGAGLQCYCIKNGIKKKWERYIGINLYKYSGVAIDDSDNVYVCGSNGKVYSFNDSGKRLWVKRLADKRHKAWGNPSIDIENQRLLVSFSLAESVGLVYCLNLNGEVLWQKEIIGGIRGSITIGYKNHYYACGLNGNLYYLNKTNGKADIVIKISDAKRALWTSAVIDPNNNILITCKDGNIEGRMLCFDSGGKKLWEVDTGKSLSSAVIGKDGELFIGSWKGYFGCFK